MNKNTQAVLIGILIIIIWLIHVLISPLIKIKPLPSRRPTKGQRLEWKESIVRAEGRGG